MQTLIRCLVSLAISVSLVTVFTAQSREQSGFQQDLATSVTEREIRPAVSKTLALLLNSSNAWFRTQSCASCHHQDLPLMAFDLARRRGFTLDTRLLEQITTKSFAAYGNLTNLDRMLQGSDFMDTVTGMGARLIVAASLGLPRSASTAVVARLIGGRQCADGHWMPGDDIRPPQSFSPFKQTAVGLRVVQLFLPASNQEERQMRNQRAQSWLAQAKPRDTEDRVYQLFGLNWAESKQPVINRYRDELLAEQRPDGGWAQLPDRASDAYATGEVLAALNQSAGVPPSSAAYQRGLRFLLTSQRADGMWFVSGRIHPPAPLSPPYFETGLPYGHDQFISAMGTSWAAAALILALPESSNPLDPLDLRSLQPGSVPDWAQTLLFGGTADLKKLLNAGWDPNSATAKGTTAAMLSAPDLEKLTLLASHGANLRAKSKTGYTALMIAASHHATGSVLFLLDRGVEVQPAASSPAQYGATALALSALSGDVQAVDALRRKGASTRTTMLPSGLFPVTPLSVAATQGNAPMVKALILGGSSVNEIASPDEITPIGWSVFHNDIETTQLLLKLGADVNHVDQLGYTPLLWAASVDFGDSRMLELLLRAGADPKLRTKEGLTALQLANQYRSLRHQSILEKVR